MIVLFSKMLLLGLLVFGGASWVDASVARIILKDGTIEETDRVWASEQYIHFILKGTQSVEIRYAKSIVERIEYLDDRRPDPTPSPEPDLLKGDPTPGKLPADEDHGSGTEGSTLQDRAPQVDRRIIEANRNVSFYDPHRPERYWAGRQSRHTTLDAALEALAGFYEHSIDWVVAHMGEENDLGRIHANLIAALDGRSKEDDQTTERVNTAKILEQESIAVPSVEAGAPSGSGIQFYDPRRPKKFWTSPSTHHHTLQEAVVALAEFYGVKPSWIEARLGHSNDLSQIHRNIQASLQSESRD